jgi:cation transport protein ChaC
MWKPGFAPVEARRARLNGYHRALCIYSHVYCGTPERPGLVLGLDFGGSCLGLALRIAAADTEEVLRRVDAREMVTGVYQPRRVPVTLLGAGARARARRVMAHTFVADRGHRQYAGNLPPARAAALIAEGRGKTGSSRAYLENTIAHLETLGIRDAALERMCALVRRESKRM